MIRKAEEKDIYLIMSLVHKFHKESLSEYGLDIWNDTTEATTRLFIANHILLVAEKEGKLIGLIGGVVMPSSFGMDILGQEFMWYLDKDERRGRIGFELLTAFEKECKNKGANKVIMIHMLNLNSEGMENFYLKRGYKAMEKHYIKDIKENENESN